jgi:hypothetical protein
MPVKIFPSPHPWKTFIYFLSVWICLFWTFHVIESYSVWPLCLSSFTEHNVFNIHPCSMCRFHCMGRFYLCSHQWIDTWVDFTVSFLMNDAYKNFCKQVLNHVFLILLCSDYSVELLWYIRALKFNLLRNCYLFFKVTLSFYISTSIKRCSFSSLLLFIS